MVQMAGTGVSAKWIKPTPDLRVIWGTTFMDSRNPFCYASGAYCLILVVLFFFLECSQLLSSLGTGLRILDNSPPHEVQRASADTSSRFPDPRFKPGFLSLQLLCIKGGDLPCAPENGRNSFCPFHCSCMYARLYSLSPGAI